MLDMKDKTYLRDGREGTFTYRKVRGDWADARWEVRDFYGYVVGYFYMKPEREGSEEFVTELERAIDNG